MGNHLSRLEYEGVEKLYQQIEPYHYIEQYVESVEAYLKKNKLDVLSNITDKTLYRFITLVSGSIRHPLYKVVNLDDDIVPLITDTKPNFNAERHLPFSFMFINKQIRIGNKLINGFLLSNTTNKSGEEDIGISATILDKNNEYETFATYTVNENFTYSDASGIDLSKHEEVMSSKILRQLACNLIDLMTSTNEGVEMFEQTFTSEQNAKRIKRGQSPHRNKLVIRLTGMTKTYARYYTLNRKKISVRFLVRGHWRRFQSEKYSDEVRGTKKWVYPFFKNQYAPDEIKKFIELRCKK